MPWNQLLSCHFSNYNTGLFQLTIWMYATLDLWSKTCISLCWDYFLQTYTNSLVIAHSWNTKETWRVFPINKVAGSMSTWGLWFYIKIEQRNVRSAHFCATLQFLTPWRTLLFYWKQGGKYKCAVVQWAGFHADSFQFMFWVYASVSRVVDLYLVPKDKVRVDKHIPDDSALFLLLMAPKIV